MNQYLLVHIFRTLLAIALGIYVIQSKVVGFGLWLPNIYVYVSLLIILWISIKGLTKKNATIDLKKSRLLGALALLVFVVCCSSHVYLRSKIRRINEQISIITISSLIDFNGYSRIELKESGEWVYNSYSFGLGKKSCGDYFLSKDTIVFDRSMSEFNIPSDKIFFEGGLSDSSDFREIICYENGTEKYLHELHTGFDYIKVKIE